MKKRHVMTLALLSLTTAVFGFNLSKNNNNEIQVEASYTKTGVVSTYIDLNPVDDTTIRNYYGSLNSLTPDEKQGTNLLKNLKPILKNNQRYYKYDTDMWKLYEILDRDWVKSPASEIPGYNASTNTITNYQYLANAANIYLHALYDDRELPNTTVASDHSTSENGINREHVWPKSHGFNVDTLAGAPGDPMALVAANSLVNQQEHNNNFYGFVDRTKTYSTQPYAKLKNNLRGISRTLGGTASVFEPQDSDKGDIARMVFYMAARYNYYSGSDPDGIDSSNPNLEIVQSQISPSLGYESTTTTTGKLGIISDLLAWHTLDPVDACEIRRNDILYRNYSKNRNPFVDFPSWAYYIWGDANIDGTGYNPTPTGVANPQVDFIHEFNDDTIQPTSLTLNVTDLTIQINQTFHASVVEATPANATREVNWSVESGTDVVSVTKTGVITGLKVGNAVVRASALHNAAVYKDINVTVTNEMYVPVSSISLNKTSTTLLPGQTEQLTATVLPTNASNKDVQWLSSHSGVVTVNNGLITAVSSGQATIMATTLDGGKTATCLVTVVDEPVTISSTAYREALFGPAYNEKGVSSYINDGFYAENNDPNYDEPFRVNTVNVYNYINDPTWSFVRIGHKSSVYTATITTDKPMAVPIKNIELGIEVRIINGIGGARLYMSPVSDFTSNVISYPVSIPNTKGQSLVNVKIASPAANQYYRLEFDCIANGTTSNGSLQINNIAYFEYVTATKYAQYFLQNTICDATGMSAPTFLNSNSWATLKTHYTNLDINEQQVLRNAYADAYGDPVERAMARYDLIVGKYGTAAFDDFIARNPEPLGQHLVNAKTSLDFMFLILATLAVVPLIYLGFRVYKRKKNQ